MRVLFSSTWGHGHVFPMVPLARAFAAAGHTVLWATNEPACALVAAAGLDVVAAGLDTAGVAQVAQRLQTTVVGVRPQDRAAFVFPRMFGEWATPSMAADLLALAREWRPDLIVHEQAELAGPLVAAVLGLPSVTHSFGGPVPAPILAAAGERVSHLWAAQGLSVPACAGSFTGPYLDIYPPGLRAPSPEHDRACQPLRPGAYCGERTGPLPACLLDDDPRPLVYLTLGTVANDASVLAAATAALADLDARVLVTVGPRGDPTALGPQPEQVSVERWVPNNDVLPRCTAVVSHGGSGTFLGALSHGLAQVCLPQAADQFRNARALVASGAGIALDPDQATPQAIRQAVGRVLVEDGFIQAADELGEQVRAMPGPDEVVAVLEQLA